MTLKSIMFALAYNADKKTLVRKEGARRVKQAQKMITSRQRSKAITFGHRYGMSSKTLAEANQTCLGIERTNLSRKESAGKTFKMVYGQEINTIFEGEADRLAAMQGFKNIH